MTPPPWWEHTHRVLVAPVRPAGIAPSVVSARRKKCKPHKRLTWTNKRQPQPKGYEGQWRTEENAWRSGRSRFEERDIQGFVGFKGPELERGLRGALASWSKGATLNSWRCATLPWSTPEMTRCLLPVGYRTCTFASCPLLQGAIS